MPKAQLGRGPTAHVEAALGNDSPAGDLSVDGVDAELDVDTPGER